MTKKGNIPWNKGKKGLQKSYWLGKKHTDSTKEKMRVAKLGKMPSNIEQLRVFPPVE